MGQQKIETMKNQNELLKEVLIAVADHNKAFHDEGSSDLHDRLLKLRINKALQESNINGYMEAVNDRKKIFENYKK